MSQLFVSMYHYVRDIGNSRYPAIKGLDYNLFKQQIEFFKENFNVVTMEDVIDAVSGGKELPPKALLLTFDDGYIDHYTYVLPVLRANQMQGSFFMPGKTLMEDALLDVNKVHFVLASSDEKELFLELLRQMDYYRGAEFSFPSNRELIEQFGREGSRFDLPEVIFIKRMLQTVLPERLRNIITTNLFKEFVGIEEKKFARELYMNRDQIRMLKDSGMYVGLHGYDHYWLGNLPREKMIDDVEKALGVMDEFIDHSKWVMNYPYGSFSQDVLDFIKKKGACIGLTTEVRGAELGKDPALQLPRLDCNDFPPKSGNYMKWMKEW